MSGKQIKESFTSFIYSFKRLYSELWTIPYAVIGIILIPFLVNLLGGKGEHDPSLLNDLAYTGFIMMLFSLLGFLGIKFNWFGFWKAYKEEQKVEDKILTEEEINSTVDYAPEVKIVDSKKELTYFQTKLLLVIIYLAYVYFLIEIFKALR